MYFVGGMMKEDLHNEQQYDTNLFDTIIILNKFILYIQWFIKNLVSFLSNTIWWIDVCPQARSWEGWTVVRYKSF